MMSTPRMIADPQFLAEGRCRGVPYDTELVSIDGVRVHFWLEGRDPKACLVPLVTAARNQRDVVAVTYSPGAPLAYWAHEDFGAPL